jgi:hypothetical protein
MLDSRFASNVPSYGNFLCGLTFYRELVSISNQLANYSLISFIFLIGFYILIGFLIGSLFGGIISIKNKKIIIGKPKK